MAPSARALFPTELPRFRHRDPQESRREYGTTAASGISSDGLSIARKIISEGINSTVVSCSLRRNGGKIVLPKSTFL